MSKIIQIMYLPSSMGVHDRFLGLGDDGVTYVVGSRGQWEAYIPSLNAEDIIKSMSSEKLHELLTMIADECDERGAG